MPGSRRRTCSSARCRRRGRPRGASCAQWRRRRASAPVGPARAEPAGRGTAGAGPRSEPGRRFAWRQRAWRMDRRAAARVAWTAPPEYARGGAQTDLVPAPVARPTEGRLGKMPSVYCTGRGRNAGSRFLLDSDLTTAGRHPESDIFLDDVTVSRRHAEFYRQAGRFTVRDVGSLNGTYVNRERIEETELSGGDEVQVGKFRLLFLLSPRSQAEFGGGGAQVGG